MAIRTTVDIPEPLHDALRQRAERSKTSIRALIIRALERTYDVGPKGGLVEGPLVRGRARLGPAFPKDENPHDLVLS
jgi:hypothetical protein